MSKRKEELINSVQDQEVELNNNNIENAQGEEIDLHDDNHEIDADITEEVIKTEDPWIGPKYIKRISSNMLIKDDFMSVSSGEKTWLEKYSLSERRIQTVLGPRRTIRCGVATLAYYQMFDSILSKKITRDYRQLGALMQNTPYIKSILTAVLAAIPVRSGLRNQGYLKSHMNLQRAFIQADLERIINKSFVVSDKDRNDSLSESLSWIIQTILMFQFAKNHLIDYSELSISNLTTIDEFVMNVSDVYQFRDYILSEYVHEGIKRLSRLSEAVTQSINKVDDEPSSRGIEMSLIISDTMKIVEEISDYLLILEQRKNSFFTLLAIMRIYRDRNVLQQIPLFNEVMSIIMNFAGKNSRFFETYTNNFEFNKWMDDIDESTLINVRNNIMAQLIGNEHVLTDLMVHMDGVLNQSTSLIRIYTKEQFIDQFNILIKKDEYIDKTKHCFISRKIGQINTPEVYELMVQTERPYQRVVRDVTKDTFILIAGKFYNKNAYEILLDAVTQGLIASAEASFSAIADTYIPDIIDLVVHQSTQLYKDDLNKLAALKCDKQLVYYESYMAKIIQNYIPEFNNRVILESIYSSHNADNKRNSKFLSLPIYVKKIQRQDSSHMDIYRDLSGARFIVTREPRRIIEDGDSQIGSSYELINSDMIKHPKAFASSRTMKETFGARMTVVDTNTVYDIVVPRQFSGYGTDMLMSVSTGKLWTPINEKNWLVVNNNPYKNLVDDYCKTLEIFKMHLYQLGHNISIDSLIKADDSFISRELSQAIVKQYKDFTTTHHNVKNRISEDALWYHMISSVDRAYEDIMNDITSFESGEFIALGDNQNAKKYRVGMSKTASVNKAVEARIKNIFGTLNFNYVCTFQANFYGFIDKLLKNDDLLRSLLYSVQLKEADSFDSIGLQEHLSILKMFETDKGSSIARMIELSCASIILALLYTPTLYGGDSANVFGSDNQLLLRDKRSFMSRLIIQFNAWAYEKFNRSTIKDDLKIIENLASGSIFNYYHSERLEKNYSYEVFDISSSNTNVSDARDLGSYDSSTNKSNDYSERVQNNYKKDSNS